VSAHGVLTSGVVSQAPVVVLQTLLVQASPVQVCCWCVWTHTPDSQPETVQRVPSVSGHAVLSARGPRYGVPQMVLSRLSFGYWGNVLPAGLNARSTSRR